jgi:hypothetical protein
MISGRARVQGCGKSLYQQSLGKHEFKDCGKVWFWVEQRFKRCVKDFDLKNGFSR